MSVWSITIGSNADIRTIQSVSIHRTIRFNCLISDFAYNIRTIRSRAA